MGPVVFTCFLLLFLGAAAACAAAVLVALCAEVTEEKPAYLRLENAFEEGFSSREASNGSVASVRKSRAAPTLAREAMGASGPRAGKPRIICPPLVIPPRGEFLDDAPNAIEVDRLRDRIRNGYLLAAPELALLELADQAAEQEVYSKPTRLSDVPRPSNGHKAVARRSVGGKASSARSPVGAPFAAKATNSAFKPSGATTPDARGPPRRASRSAAPRDASGEWHA